MERAINLGQSDYGHRNLSLKKLYRVRAEFIRNGRLNLLIPAFSPELAINIAARKANIDIGTATAELESPVCLPKAYGDERRRDGLREFTPRQMGRNLAKMPLGNMDALKTAKREWMLGYAHRMKLKRAGKIPTLHSEDADMFRLGYNVAERQKNAEKPKKSRKKVSA